MRSEAKRSSNHKKHKRHKVLCFLCFLCFLWLLPFRLEWSSFNPTIPGGNCGKNTKPEMLTTCHEESAVAMAHGYAKIEGKPIMALLHGTVGLQHASMAIYNAYADRVPIFMVIGNHMDSAVRGGGVNWYHSAQDMCLMVRDFLKWDDEPKSLQAFASNSVRAYRLMMTPPMGPVAIV